MANQQTSHFSLLTSYFLLLTSYFSLLTPMSDYQTPIIEYIKQGLFIIIIVAIAIFGIKSCRKFQKKKAILIELTSHAGESAAYEQFYTETAHENVLKAMYQMHLGSELGLTPNGMVNKVMNAEKGFFEDSEETDIPIRKELIRDALLSNFDNCLKLGLFDNASNIAAISEGEMPTITKGPATDEQVVILPIIPESVLPGSDKLMPNMMISPPPSSKKTSKETLIDRARAKRLLQSLAEAGLIERDAYKKVLEQYKKKSLIPVK